MKNFARINNYYNRIEAVKDWNRLATEVSEAGYAELARKHKPANDAGWKRIDKATAALREAYMAAIAAAAPHR